MVQMKDEIELQNRFKAILKTQRQPGRNVWLIKGDFDHIKALFPKEERNVFYFIIRGGVFAH